MKLANVDSSKFCYKKTKLLSFIEKFEASGLPVMEIKDFENEYSTLSSMVYTINNACARFGKKHIKCISQKKIPYMINAILLVDEE